MIDVLKLQKSDVFRGFNLVADESLYPALEAGAQSYGRVLQARLSGEADVQATIHAGELGDIRNLRDSMVFGVGRIGHGVKLDEDPVALELGARRQLPIEVNIKSNLILGVAQDVGSHPFLDFLRLGLMVSQSTDDEGIFESTQSEECRLAVENTDVTYDEMKRMVRNSIETAFAPQVERLRLLGLIDSELSAFEKKWASTP